MFLRSIAILLTLAGAASAQTSAGRTFLQNSDVEILFGISHMPSYQDRSTGLPIHGTTGGVPTGIGYGYQLFRFSGVSLWLQYSSTTAGPSSVGAGAAGSVDARYNAYTLGGRITAPVTSRISLLGAVGGGGGSFHYPAIANGMAQSDYTWHGVIETSGAVDIRIIRNVSFRIEARDIISARNLSGSPTPNHVVALGGIAWHN